MRSGDVELNPGPEQNVGNHNKLSVDSTTLLNFRLRQLGLRALDVGGSSDCFFRAVSHQLYGNPNNHFHIRQAAVQYLRHNPERFIESNTQNSWNGYLTIMSMQGTWPWCDALTVQAVAESLNIQIYIVESHVNFGQVTLIQPHHSSQHPRRTIYIGHVNEVHYVSTVPNSSCSRIEHYSSNCYDFNNFTEQNVLSEQVHNSGRKRKHNSNVKNIGISTEGSENNEKQSSATKQNKTNDQKQKWNSYMKNYRLTRRASKKNQVYDCDNERQKSTTKQNKKPEYQKPKREKVQSIPALISKFHNIVSQGPLYICSCCDQLWYKHSVSPAAKIRKSNPAAEKYLLNSKSVDNKEWLCRTCHNHL